MATGDKDPAFIELSGPFTGTFSSRGTSPRVDHRLAEAFEIGLQRIDEADTPIAFRADGVAVGSRTISLQQRDHDGAYWRPLLADDSYASQVPSSGLVNNA